MSDSDDTDVLLLIPPDFFFVAPSPSPVSSPSTISPPISKSIFKQERVLTEELARKSLKDITSKLKVIDRRLSLIENQHSDSMDGDRSANWFELESNTSGSTRSRPRETMEKSSDRRSMNVQELIKASVRDPSSVMQRKGCPLTQSWGSSSQEKQFLPNQRARSSSGRRDATSFTRVMQQEKEVSSDEEREQSREGRSSSLPPTPTSHQHPKKIGDYSESMSSRPSLSYQRGVIQPAWNVGATASRLSSELERGSRRRDVEEMGGGRSAAMPLTHGDGRCGWLESGSREPQPSLMKDGEKSTGYPEGRSEWVTRRPSGEERMGWDHKSPPVAEGEESFNVNLSNLDGTLGVSAILPSLSSLGLGNSILQGSLDATKESCSSTGGGAGGGLTLSEVERLLEDMHRTQLEMERSMRRGRANLGRGSGEGEGIDPRGDMAVGEAGTRAKFGGGDHRGTVTDDPKIFSPEKKDMGLCKKGAVRDEVQKREGWIMEGKNEASGNQSKSSPVKIVVDGAPKRSQPDDQTDNAQEMPMILPSERGQIEGQSARDGSLIYRSKSDESLTGGHGKSSKDKTRSKYLGVDSSDDSLFSSGPITSTQLSRVGDTLGSVPDLGLGVREMFAKPEKHREAVKEPPFVKKNMSLLGSSCPRSTDAAVLVSEGDNLRELKSFEKLAIEENAFGFPQKGSRDSNNQAWPTGHYGKEGGGLSQSHSQGNNSGVDPMMVNRSQVDPNEQQMPRVTPQKYLYSPQSSVENRENSGRDARRQLQFEEMKRKEQEVNSPPRGNNPSSRPPVRDGGEDSNQRVGGKVTVDAATGIDHVAHGIPNSMGPVMVVGGEGRRRKRQMEGNDGGGWAGERWRGDERNMQADGRQRKCDGGRVGREQEGHWWSRGVEMSKERGGGTWKDGRRKWTMRDGGYRSLDDHLGQARGGRFKESAFQGGGPQSFHWDPMSGGHGFLNESDMWVPPLSAGVTAAEEIITLRRKLEEERFRREHCERVIEEVGRRGLEAQERLAVSQGLSKAKDVALGKFREAWEEAVSGWKREGEARIALEEEVDRYRGRVDAEITYRDQRQKQLEEDLVRLGAESSSLREELRKGQREAADMTARLSSMLEAATKEVTTCRQESESALMREARAKDAATKAEDTAKEAMKKSEEATKRADLTESDKNMLKQELETLQGKQRDSNSRVSTLEGRLADAEVDADKARQNEKKARGDLILAQQELDKERLKLKEFYQSQVEELVKSKVNEFQGQLDATELSLRKEAETREEQAKRLGEEKLKLLNQKHSQEVSLLEQKHEEELALWNLRLKRTVVEAENLRAQVSKYNAQKAQLAKGLHALMQTQLKQGLRLIASGGEGVDNESVSTPPKRLEKKLSSAETSWRDVMSSLNFHENAHNVPEKDLIPKKDTDLDLGYSSMIKEKTEKEMISSNTKSSVPSTDLKKYIHMLLDREPGKPVNWMGMGSDSDEDVENQRTGVKHRHQLETKEMNKPLATVAESGKVSLKERKGTKKRKERECLSKQSKDAPLQALWEPMAFKLSEPSSSGQMFGSDTSELDGQRYRKPPWK